MCSILGGSLSLLSHLSGQLREGSASVESLAGGAAAMILGGLFCLLGDFGKRLIRLEEQTTNVNNSVGETEDLANHKL